MRIESNYPTPIQGVSTLAARNRARGQAGLQTNMRSDPVTKLTRRPSLKWQGVLADIPNDIAVHTYYRREREITIIVDKVTGVVHPFVNGVLKSVTGTLGAYGIATNIVMETINDTTFFVNKDVVTTMETTIDEGTLRKVTHVNVLSALNYSETLEIVGEGSPSPIGVSIVIPDATAPEVADPLRKTNAVAEEIASQINLVTGYTALAQGSSVAVYRDVETTYAILTVSAGSGDDDVVVFNESTESIAGIPLYALPNTLLTVKPDPTTADGTYYLKAVPLDGATAALTVMQEVVWTESRSPLEPYGISPETMPHTIRYDYDTDGFVVGEAETGWEERTKGDNESVPVPAFIGRAITALGQFQKRLVLISDNDVEMTVTDNLYNWWKQSAIDLLVTDPISITSNSTGIDVLQYIVEHNRDVLFAASNGQFKIDGTQGVTPQTVAMPLTTSQEIQISVPPITMGTSVFFPINYGESTGITEYTGQRDQSDIASPITQHVIGYMKGEAKLLVGSPNLEMIALTTTESLVNEIFIYEQFSNAGKKTQMSWSRWVLPTDNEILHMTFRRDKLDIVVRVGTAIILKSIDMYSRVAVNTSEVFLDELLLVSSTDGNSVEVPAQYPDDVDIKVIGGDGTKYPLFKIDYTRVGTTLTFDPGVSDGEACSVYIGKTYRSAYRPTRPFREDEQGIAITTDRVRVNRYVLSVVDTERVTMTTLAKYTTPPDQTKTFRVLNSLNNLVGEINLYTGDFQFSYGQNAEYSDAEFWTEGWLGLTIASISWKGQYHKSSGRL